MRNAHLILALGLMASCGKESAPSDVKMVGVGFHPDEIGPAPVPYGGVVEYSWVDFAGGGLSLGVAGLLSFSEVDGIASFKPPFAMIYGFSYIFDVKLPGAAGVGMIQPPPTTEGTCYTVFEPSGPIGSFTTTDLGNEIRFVGDEGERFSLSRVPADYPPNPQDMFIYYSSIESWLPESKTHRVPGETTALHDMEERILRPANFPFGKVMSLEFPGGFAKDYAPVGSIPVPSSAIGNPQVPIPARMEGVKLSWDGKRYFWGTDADDYDQVVWDEASSGQGDGVSTCLRYHWPHDAAPEDAEACLDAPDFDGERGQFYTGPWDTESGVRFEWLVPEEPNEEILTLTVRFLGPVDRLDNIYYQRHMRMDQSGVPARDTVACEDGEWVFDPTLYDATYLEKVEDGKAQFSDDAPLGPALQGDPMHTMVDVVCRIPDTGEFTLTQDMIQRGYGLAMEAGAEGALFLLSRTSTVEAEVPDVKDMYHNRRPITPILVSARTVELGRFWFDPDQQTPSVSSEEK